MTGYKRKTIVPYKQEDTDRLLSQMVAGGLDLSNVPPKHAQLIAAFAFARGRILHDTLQEQEHQKDMLMAIAETLVESVGMARVLDALMLVAFNYACDDNLSEVDQNAWRRTGNAVLEARGSARSNEL